MRFTQQNIEGFAEYANGETREGLTPVNMSQ